MIIKNGDIMWSMSSIVRNTYSQNQIQPYPKACTPTALAYLIKIITGKTFSNTINKLFKIGNIYSRIVDNNRGISEEDITKEVRTKEEFILGSKFRIAFNKAITTASLNKTPYVVGVSKLRNFSRENIFTSLQKKSLESAQFIGSLIITNGYFIYPRGHAITVLTVNPDYFRYFDPYLGCEVDSEFRYLIEGVNWDYGMVRIIMNKNNYTKTKSYDPQIT